MPQNLVSVQPSSYFSNVEARFLVAPRVHPSSFGQARSVYVHPDGLGNLLVYF